MSKQTKKRKIGRTNKKTRERKNRKRETKRKEKERESEGTAKKKKKRLSQMRKTKVMRIRRKKKRSKQTKMWNLLKKRKRRSRRRQTKWRKERNVQSGGKNNPSHHYSSGDDPLSRLDRRGIQESQCALIPVEGLNTSRLSVTQIERCTIYISRDACNRRTKVILKLYVVIIELHLDNPVLFLPIRYTLCRRGDQMIRSLRNLSDIQQDRAEEEEEVEEEKEEQNYTD